MQATTVVGYSTRQFKDNNFRMFGIPWETVQGGLNINDILSGLETTAEINWEEVMDGADPLDYVGNAPQIQVQIVGGTKDGNYHKYWYVKNALTSFDEETGAYTTEKGWCDLNGMYADPELTPDDDGSMIPGTSAWFKDPSAEAAFAVTGAGAVNKARQTITCPAAFRLRAAMRPMEVQVNTPSQIAFEDLDASSTINWEDIMEGGDPLDYVGNAPQLQVQIIGGAKDGNYHKYWYVSNALTSFDEETGAYTTDEGWCDLNGMYVDPELTPDDDGTIQVGAGFWAKGTTQAFTMVFPKMD